MTASSDGDHGHSRETEPFTEVHETHSGVVLLYGERAFKTKKPITTDFLDFGTVEARRAACHRELELNRRLAPDVYLGLAELTDPLGGPSEPVLVMRRMPAGARLATRLAEGAVTGSELARLAKVLADFHRSALRGPHIDRAGEPAALRLRWHALLHSLAEQPPHALDDDHILRAGHLSARFIEGREALLADRIRDGRLIDGHGDLLAQDIFVLPDGFRILDCLDFDDQLRYVDGLDDAAFLAMDLEFQGHPKLSEAFLTGYLRAAEDDAPAGLWHHYIAYRAMVRAKTDRIRAGQGDSGAAERARRHLDLAVRHLERGAVRLALIGGLPGTGKSTIAREVAERTGAHLLSSDTLRVALRSAGTLTGTGGTYGQGVYRPENRALVYDELLGRARDLLSQGHSVILDASWLDSSRRAHAAALAEQTCSELLELQCRCPVELATTRLYTREPGHSEADPVIAAALAADAAAWPTAVTIDTGGSLENSFEQALRAWRGTPH